MDNNGGYRKKAPSNNLFAAFSIVAILLLAISTPALYFDYAAAGSDVDDAQGKPDPENTGRLVFSSNESGDWEVYSMNPDGTDFINLSNNPDAEDKLLYVSSDKTRIIFSSDDSDKGEPRRYSVAADGKGLEDVTASTVDPDDYVSLSHSPDDSKIAYVMDGNIFRAEGDGSNSVQLTNTGLDGTPAWSLPDGKFIAFSRSEPDFPEDSRIYVMNATDGSSQTVIESIPLFSSFPVWSPDGRHITFQFFTGEWFVVNVEDVDIGGNGSGEGSFVAGLSRYGPIYWSPDSSKIAVNNSNPNIGVVFTVFYLEGDGSDNDSIVSKQVFFPEGTLIPHWDFPWYASWSPDSAKLAFISLNQTASSIYTWHVLDNAQKVADPIPVKSEEPSVQYEGLEWIKSPADDISAPEEKSILTVETVDLLGNPVEGVWTLIHSAEEEDIVASGYTPFSFTADRGVEYEVTVHNYYGKTFDHWEDDAAASQSRTISLTADTTLTAVYDTGNSLRGFTPLMFEGTSDLPQLTVNAVSIEGNQTLHMSTIIDPQSTDESGTNYTVYIHSYLDIIFDHWEDGSTDRVRTLTISEDTTIAAYFTTEESSPTEEGDGKVAFVSAREDGNSDIYTMNADGTEQTKLTSDDGEDLSPVWSPDGSKIAFQRLTVDGTSIISDIYVMGADGSNEVRLTGGEAFYSSPTWLPNDSNQIAFLSDSIGEKAIYIVDSSGEDNPEKLEFASPLPADTREISWSPDGSKIALLEATFPPELFLAPSTTIYVTDADGRNGLTAIAEGTRPGGLCWSPDSTKIVFSVGQIRPPVLDIYVINADGTGLEALTEDVESGTDVEPCWSPDGQKVVFAADSIAGIDIYVMNADGSDRMALTEDGSSSSPNWGS